MRQLRQKHRNPGSCRQCGRSGRLHLHHVGLSFSDLFDLGVHDDLSQHRVTYLCPDCHAKAHEGEKIAGIINSPASITAF